jgi:hypothetical protein
MVYWSSDATYGAIVGAAGALISLVVVLYAADWVAGWITGARMARRRHETLERESQQCCIHHANQQHWSKYT